MKKNPFVKYVQAKDITIECDKDIIYDVDGEEGTTFPIHVCVKKQSLHVIVP